MSRVPGKEVLMRALFILGLTLMACGSSSAAPLTVNEGKKALDTAGIILHCQAIGRAVYEDAGGLDGGRESGLSAYDTCMAEGGLHE
jgi:hypothetical protein